MTLEITYDKAEAIPAGFATLYTEKEGKFVLTGVNGIKTQADVDMLQSALVKERNDHKAAREALTPFKALGDLSAVQAKLDRISELEVAAAGKINDEEINKIVESRINTRIAPIQRELDTTKAALNETLTLNETFKQEKKLETVKAEMRKAAADVKCINTAIPDIEIFATLYFDVNELGQVVAKENAGPKLAGLPPKLWLQEQQTLKPHWWPVNVGGGAAGSGTGGIGENPWSAKGWNVTKQMAMVRDNPAQAEQLSKAAGVAMTGGTRPTQKA